MNKEEIGLKTIRGKVITFIGLLFAIAVGTYSLYYFKINSYQAIMISMLSWVLFNQLIDFGTGGKDGKS